MTEDLTQSENEQRIEEFKKYMENKLKAIEKISSKHDEVLFKKIIYFSFIESMAKASFPEEKSVNKRFMRFLYEFAKWEEGEYYCPIHLIKENTLSTDVLEDCKIKISAIYDTYEDRVDTTIEKFAVVNSAIPENRYKCKFKYLLYDARNALVHQFQASSEWAESVERRGVSSPFYEVIGSGGEIFLNPTNNHIEIIFPNVFLKKLAKDGLLNFINYCKKEGKNPFPLYYAERIIHKKEVN